MHRTTWIYVHLPIYKSNIFFWKLHCLTAFPFLQTNENITFSPRTTTVRHTITKLITLIDEFRHIFAPPLPQLFLEWSAVLLIGVNFYKAARLEPPLFKLLGFRASEPPTFLSHAMPIMKLSSVVYRTIKWLQMIFMPIRPPVLF